MPDHEAAVERVIHKLLYALKAEMFCYDNEAHAIGILSQSEAYRLIREELAAAQRDGYVRALGIAIAGEHCTRLGFVGGQCDGPPQEWCVGCVWRGALRGLLAEARE